ncbi:cytidylyltransferase domain-containing protein [Butyrivibrio sp. JL13D10]|uniref:acylneuraminate cytidylyltransferase family protein n=1 Tax=Butyrivibrio sp. JL13D10 TaxID=3236815 RepID=UPI0038B5D58B
MGENIAIIPARSGSKGLPDKNIKELCGKPLMGYTIEAAKDAEVFDEVFVSTDSEKYAEIARKCGADVPFLRSSENAADRSSSWDVVEEVLRKYEQQGRIFDTFCLLQPTSPLRSAVDIKKAYDTFYEKRAKFVVSVCETEHPITWCGEVSENLSMDGFIDRAGMGQRQSVSKSYRLNGAIYIADVNEFRADRFLYREGCYAYIMDSLHSIDIDTQLDFDYAGFLMSRGISVE